MSRQIHNRLGAAAVVAALAVLGACADGPASPAGAPAFARKSAGTTTVTTTSGTDGSDTTHTTFVYRFRTGTTQSLGEHWIEMPALSVCDPSSSYGIGEWDQPCTPAKSDITIRAKYWTSADGRPHIDFDKHLRFVPTTNGREMVKLYFRDRGASDVQLMDALRIDWVPYVGATPVDESATDPELRTFTNSTSGIAWRRIKHFSGYMVASGRME